MKKVFQFLSVTLAIVLCMSLGAALVYLGQGQDHFKPSKCLTDALEQGMSMKEISVAYEEACVSVICENNYLGTELGSAICVASIKDYKTVSGYEVSKGSYFVTNYHVVQKACDPDYKTIQAKVSIVVDDGNYVAHEASVLWANHELDMAILFCGEQIDNLNFVKMRDRWIDCEDAERLRRDDVFTQGTPLDISFANTYSEGYVSNSKAMQSATTKDFYYSGTEGNYVGTGNKLNAVSYRSTSVTENVYEDLIMVNLDITHGNSGGGLFDSQGYLVGLTTLGLVVDETNGAAMNFAVPIYPAIEVLDKLIENNEKNAGHGVYSYQDLGLTLFDANMADFALSVQDQTNDSFYYVDGKILQYNEEAKLNFDRSGVYIYSNSGAIDFLKPGCVITGATNSDGIYTSIDDRNDLIYFLLDCEKGDSIQLSYRDTNDRAQKGQFVLA